MYRSFHFKTKIIFTIIVTITIIKLIIDFVVVIVVITDTMFVKPGRCFINIISNLLITSIVFITDNVTAEIVIVSSSLDKM